MLYQLYRQISHLAVQIRVAWIRIPKAWMACSFFTDARMLAGATDLAPPVIFVVLQKYVVAAGRENEVSVVGSLSDVAVDLSLSPYRGLWQMKNIYFVLWYHLLGFPLACNTCPLDM
jgi:hypothetical protein